MKPILFNTEMVRAIIEDRKIKTRRLVNKAISDHFEIDVDGSLICYIDQATGDRYNPVDLCRYKSGDILYVRETWRIGTWNEDISSVAVDYKAGGFARKDWINIEDQKAFERYWIQSTDDAEKAGSKMDENGQYHWKPGDAPTRWRPSIHMPKEMARLFIRIKSVRIERIQSITCTEAEEEGVTLTSFWTPSEMDDKPFDEKWWDDYYFWTHYPQIAFSRLWDSTIDMKNHWMDQSWSANPWVWVLEFEKISKEAAVESDRTQGNSN